MRNDINIQRISTVNSALGALKQKVVFVGGATLSLYAELPQVDIRPTKDVDILVELTYKGYANIEEEIRKLGFKNDVESGVICRYMLGETIVDIMPTNEDTLGFTNIWYQEGYENSIEQDLPDGSKVKILSAPYFLATKLEAFKSRGKYDGRVSHDFEDIVFILESRPSIWEELNKSPSSLTEYFKIEFAKLLSHPSISEWIGGHVERRSPPSTNYIIEKLEAFVNLP